MTSLALQFELLMKGGVVMIPLLLSGLISLIIIIERFWLLRIQLQTPKQAAIDILKAIPQKNWGPLETRLSGSKSPAIDVMRTGILKFESGAVEDMQIDLAMKNQAEEWVPVLEKRIDILDTIITAAPLMGLLGTIIGMISSFQVLSDKGINEPHAITGGVAEALIATATGLVVALVTLVAYNYLNTTIKDLIFDMEHWGSKTMEALVHLRMDGRPDTPVARKSELSDRLNK